MLNRASLSFITIPLLSLGLLLPANYASAATNTCPIAQIDRSGSSLSRPCAEQFLHQGDQFILSSPSATYAYCLEVAYSIAVTLPTGVELASALFNQSYPTPSIVSSGKILTQTNGTANNFTITSCVSANQAMQVKLTNSAITAQNGTVQKAPGLYYTVNINNVTRTK